MTGAIVQCASGDYSPLLAATLTWHGRYSEHHGLTYIPVFGNTMRERHANWSRFPLLIQTLRMGFADIVIWLDADCVIADANTSLLETADEILYIGMVQHTESWSDWGFHYNAGAMYIRNTPRSLAFLENVHAAGRIDAPPGWENQGTIHTMIEKERFPVSRLNNKWNATPRVNDVLHPVVIGFHNTGLACLPNLLAIADKNLREAYK